jgi:biotin transport system substrate-specific component
MSQETKAMTAHQGERAVGRTKTKDMVLIGVMAALICIAGPLSIPLPFTPVPISLTNLAIYIVLFIVGWKRGTMSFLVYLLLGFVGLPVFSKGQAGAAILLGPTGGYLVGFLFIAVISGIVIEKYAGRVVPSVLGILVGLAITYLFGTVWYCFQAGIGFVEALGMCVIPFLPGDALKIIIAAILGPMLKKYLHRAGVLD